MDTSVCLLELEIESGLGLRASLSSGPAGLLVGLRASLSSGLGLGLRPSLSSGLGFGLGLGLRPGLGLGMGLGLRSSIVLGLGVGLGLRLLASLSSSFSSPELEPELLLVLMSVQAFSSASVDRRCHPPNYSQSRSASVCVTGLNQNVIMHARTT